jgi:hypothetical protein
MIKILETTYKRLNGKIVFPNYELEEDNLKIMFDTLIQFEALLQFLDL